MPVPGKTGRLPRDHSRPAPRFEDYLIEKPAAVAALPVVGYRADVDYGSHVHDWPMYCNGPDPENATVCPGSPDGCGDCAWAYWGHAVQALSLYVGGAEVTIPAANIIAAYSDCTGYNPLTGANDNGTQLQDALAYMQQVGIPDATGKVHKIAGYALVANPHVQETVAQVLQLGGTGYVGVNLQQAQEDQFSMDEPWRYVAGSPVVGGHAIGLQQRAGSGLTKIRCTTWGTLWHCSDSFWTNCVEEFWYVVSADDIAANGVSRAGYNLEQLLADMSKFS